jgi:catechol 2,3-dioxygenase-like lactoylglutathione lyase family enzyme
VSGVVYNHVGLCVSDLARSRRFYEELLGFECQREMTLPDEGVDKMLRIAPPVGLTAVYLGRDGLVLELLHFERPGNPPASERVFNEPGLTHLSFSVDDVDDVAARVADYGGEALEDTNIGFGLMIRDPDGQLLELLPMAYREMVDGEGST